MPTNTPMIDTLHHTAEAITSTKVVALSVAGLVAIGVAISGFQNLPDRVTALEEADERMQESVKGIEARMSTLEGEIRMMTCLQLAEMQDLPYQQCL